MHDCSYTLIRSLAGATGKAGNGKRDGNRKGDRTRTGNMIQNQRQDDLWLVEILLTNEESGLTMILFMNLSTTID